MGSSCWYKKFLSCLGCSSRPSTEYFFPHRTIVHFICPHRPASWASSRAVSPVSYIISISGWDSSSTFLLFLFPFRLAFPKSFSYSWKLCEVISGIALKPKLVSKVNTHPLGGVSRRTPLSQIHKSGEICKGGVYTNCSFALPTHIGQEFDPNNRGMWTWFK